MQVSSSDISSASTHLAEMAPAVLEKCAALSTKFSMNATEFVVRLEAFLINNNVGTATMDVLTRLEQDIHRELTQQPLRQKNSAPTTAQKPPLVPTATRRVLDTPSPISGATKRPSFDTPLDQKPAKIPHKQGDTLSPDSMQSPIERLTQITGNSSAPAYRNRTNSGQSVLAINQSLGPRKEFEPSDAKPLAARCRIVTTDDDHENVKQRYRFMFTTLDERARSLDKHLLKMQQSMCEFACIAPTDLKPVGVPSQDTVWVCGRVCCEAAQGRINKTSVMLEGSRRESSGRKVQLDLSEVPSFSLFPGQIVLVEGINSSGRRMVAKRIVEGVPPPAPTTAPAKLLDFHHSTLYQGGKPLSVVVAAGPFTTSDNLDYEPFEDLLGRVFQSKPDVLLLVGPFVDVTQPLLASGDVKLQSEDVPAHDASYEMVFVEKIVRDGIGALFNTAEERGVTLPTHIILVPSLQDGHHEMVFPQPPFGDRDRVDSKFFEDPLGVLNIPFSKDDDIRKRVHLMPNPCMFRVNEILFGVTANDVLHSMSSEEVSSNLESGHRLSRLAAHVLYQNSFAPQFPPPQTLLSQLDMRHSKHWEITTTPDVLILPSKLAQMAKNVNNTLVLNPGQISKGTGGGTFAEVSIHPLKESDLRDAKLANKESLPHNVFARSYVNIARI